MMWGKSIDALRRQLSMIKDTASASHENGPLLNNSIARAVAGDLVVLLGTSDFATAQLANFTRNRR